MGTIEEWLAKLPDGYREAALKNRMNKITKTGTGYPVIVCSMNDAIMNGFVWCETPEGEYIWQMVYAHFCSIEGILR